MRAERSDRSQLHSRHRDGGEGITTSVQWHAVENHMLDAR